MWWSGEATARIIATIRVDRPPAEAARTQRASSWRKLRQFRRWRVDRSVVILVVVVILVLVVLILVEVHIGERPGQGQLLSHDDDDRLRIGLDRSRLDEFLDDFVDARHQRAAPFAQPFLLESVASTNRPEQAAASRPRWITVTRLTSLSIMVLQRAVDSHNTLNAGRSKNVLPAIKDCSNRHASSNKVALTHSRFGRPPQECENSGRFRLFTHVRRR